MHYFLTRKNPGQNHQSLFSIKFDPPPKKMVPLNDSAFIRKYSTPQKKNEFNVFWKGTILKGNFIFQASSFMI